jgi:hypothetical protein
MSYDSFSNSTIGSHSIRLFVLRMSVGTKQVPVLFTDPMQLCATDFFYQSGAFSWQNTIFRNVVGSCNDCARQCDSYGRYCVAYECSATELACAGFSSASELLQVQYQDYRVCRKDLSGEHS